MSRPTKCRTVCHFPDIPEFIPAGSKETKPPVVLTVDEFETIRLIDKEGLSQEDCRLRMQIARTTVQKIYESARKKIAIMLTEGLPLKIEGGEYRLCDGQNRFCKTDICRRQKIYQIYKRTKGENMMRIAVTYENGKIFQHFGHTEQFKIYDIEDGKIVSSKVIDTNGEGHGALAEILNAAQVDILICGGIGGGAKTALEAAGIKLYGGVSGEADSAVDMLLSGNLNYNPNVKCSHHGEHHNGENCGGHHHGGSCGGHEAHHCG